MTPPERYPPDDPREWMNRARSDLTLARSRPEGVHLADLCLHAQQAAEKAIKALLIGRGVDFPYVHDLAALTGLFEADGLETPTVVRRAARLTSYATPTRYPGLDEPVTDAEYEEAVELAEAVVQWAEGSL